MVAACYGWHQQQPVMALCAVHRLLKLELWTTYVPSACPDTLPATAAAEYALHISLSCYEQPSHVCFNYDLSYVVQALFPALHSPGCPLPVTLCDGIRSSNGQVHSP